MTLQLAFDIPPLAALRRADYFTSPANAAALAAVEQWQGWPGSKLVLVGPAGAGKTHLAHIWADLAGAEFVRATDLCQADLPALAAARAVVVEEAEAVAGHAAAETALFHLHNLLQGGGHLLLTARSAPGDWGLCLPDLQSRVLAAGLVRLQAPDDALLAAVLIKQFADRQIAVPPALIPYLLHRMDRSFAAARDLVAALDTRALARGVPITRALAAEMLDSGGAQ